MGRCGVAVAVVVVVGSDLEVGMDWLVVVSDLEVGMDGLVVGSAMDVGEGRGGRRTAVVEQQPSA